MYDNYLRAISQVTTKYDSFKSNPDYMGVLEHVSQSFGEEYLHLLRSEFGMTNQKILQFCDINDSFGNPLRYSIGNLEKQVSPTSLRYLYHASLILKHAGHSSRFVEVGGGYGGLFLAITFLCDHVIEEYHIVDLDEALRLQKLVLSDHPNVHYHSCTTFGDEVPNGCFFISNYCFSEINSQYREGYTKSLLPRCTKGFLAWNSIQPYDFGKQIVFEIERPLTFTGNYFVYF